MKTNINVETRECDHCGEKRTYNREKMVFGPYVFERWIEVEIYDEINTKLDFCCKECLKEYANKNY